MALFDIELEEGQVREDGGMATLIEWARRFAERGWTPSYGPGDHGNMSCRVREGMLITARETAKASLRPEHFALVTGVVQRGGQWVVRGAGRRLPSTDALLHWRVYQARPEIAAILHGHDSTTLRAARRLGIPLTASDGRAPSMALLEEACQLARQHDYVLMRAHGFLSLGRSVAEAGERAETWSQRAASKEQVEK